MDEEHKKDTAEFLSKIVPESWLKKNGYETLEEYAEVFHAELLKSIDETVFSE